MLSRRGKKCKKSSRNLNLNARNYRDGNTALHLAFKYNKTSIVDKMKAFAQKHPEALDINARNGIGETALHLAFKNGNPNVVEEMLEFAKTYPKTIYIKACSPTKALNRVKKG